MNKKAPLPQGAATFQQKQPFLALLSEIGFTFLLHFVLFFCKPILGRDKKVPIPQGAATPPPHAQS